MAGGDLSEVAEKGGNLSGGQRARLALARAVYAVRDVLRRDFVHIAQGPAFRALSGPAFRMLHVMHSTKLTSLQMLPARPEKHPRLETSDLLGNPLRVQACISAICVLKLCLFSTGALSPPAYALTSTTDAAAYPMIVASQPRILTHCLIPSRSFTSSRSLPSFSWTIR